MEEVLRPANTHMTANTGDVGSIPGSGRCPRGGNGNPLQYSSLENIMDRGDWQATVQGVAKSQTRLNTEDRNSFIMGIFQHVQK